MLPRLEPADRAMLGQVGSAWRAMVVACTREPRAGLKGGVPLKVTVFVAGSVERLAWAKANGCPWGPKTCSLAATGGHLEALRWAREHGCGWDGGGSDGRGMHYLVGCTPGARHHSSVVCLT